jgi:hypothetical protein
MEVSSDPLHAEANQKKIPQISRPHLKPPNNEYK